MQGPEIPEWAGPPEGDEHADHLDELEGDDVLGPLEEHLRAHARAAAAGQNSDGKPPLKLGEHQYLTSI